MCIFGRCQIWGRFGFQIVELVNCGLNYWQLIRRRGAPPTRGGASMTPDDAVVEAVARAMIEDAAQQMTYSAEHAATSWMKDGPWKQIAVAAILAYRLAMRERGVVECPMEPTERMVENLTAQFGDRARILYRAMLA